MNFMRSFLYSIYFILTVLQLEKFLTYYPCARIFKRLKYIENFKRYYLLQIFDFILCSLDPGSEPLQESVSGF